MYFTSAKWKLILLTISFLGCKLSIAQNHNPVAVNDTASTLAEVPVLVNVLLNDYDPDGDTIRIYGYPKAQHGHCQKVDSSVRYTSYYYTGIDSIKYWVWDKPYTYTSFSNTGYLVIQVKPNPDLPQAVNDTGYTISCDSLLLNVTWNDFDPNGDTIQIDPDHIIRSRYVQVLEMINDSVLLYRSIPSFTGTDTIKYRVRKVANPDLYSDYAKAIIHIGANPEVPVVTNDTINYLSFSRNHFFPLQNDLIQTQDSIEIYFPTGNPHEYVVVNDDLSMEYYDSVMNKNEPFSFLYQVRKKHDPACYSNNARIVIRYSYDPRFFYAYDDTASVDAFGSVTVDVVTNDYNPDPADTLQIVYVQQGDLSDSVGYTDRLMTYYPDERFPGVDSVEYVITSTADPGKRSPGKVKINVRNKVAEYLDINEVRALFYAHGLHFFNRKAQFEVPKKSGKTTIFTNALWIGGLDKWDSLHFAGEKYRQGPNVGAAWTCPDFYAGPVMNFSSYGRNQDSTWSRIWKLNREDIEYHRDHYADEGYQPITDILAWPGNGDISLGQAAKLAPYFDLNADGHYNPLDGDYPEIRGDQALFFIFNDDRNYHNESQGKKLRAEIQGLAYAFDMPGDTAFKNTVFLHYTIINRSEEIYRETYTGIFTDTDIGLDWDDYVGCDVERNMYFGYNGDSIDGFDLSNHYGSHPPMQAVVLLGGPKMDDDGIDNPKFDNLGNQLCDESINGLFFGDSVVDNERFGMQRFAWFFSKSWSGPPYYQEPFVACDYYNMMKGFWTDSTEIVYGGMGHDNNGGYGPACRFMLPGNSDTLNWGTGCMPPNGPADWTMETANINPHDCRGVCSSGPFTFKPGDRQDIDIAFAWARDYNSSGPLGSLTKLQGVVDKINKAFAENRLPDGTPIYYSLKENKRNPDLEFRVYPNPSKDQITIEFPVILKGPVSIRLMSAEGIAVREFNVNNTHCTELSVSDLPGGVYIIQCRSKDSLGTKKIILAK